MAGGGRTSWKSLFFPLRKLGVGRDFAVLLLLLDVEQKFSLSRTWHCKCRNRWIVCLSHSSFAPESIISLNKKKWSWAKGEGQDLNRPIYHCTRFCIRNGKSNSGPWKWNFVVPIFDTLELWHHLLAKKKSFDDIIRTRIFSYPRCASSLLTM